MITREFSSDHNILWYSTNLILVITQILDNRRHTIKYARSYLATPTDSITSVVFGELVAHFPPASEIVCSNHGSETKWKICVFI